MSNPPPTKGGPATLDPRQRLPTTNHGPAVPTRVYQSDRASRTACRTATHPADHTNPHGTQNARNSAPTLDRRLSISDQRIDALSRANEVRTLRAQLKRDLKARRVSIGALLLNPPPYLETAKVFDMVLALPKVGRVKA